MASPSTVISLGYGTFGDVNEVITLGYGSGAEPVPVWPTDATIQKTGPASTSISKSGPASVTMAAGD